LIGKLRHVFRAAPKRGAQVGVDPLEIVEKSRRRDVARDAEARPVGNGAIGLQEEAALVIPDVFLVIRGRSARRARGRRANADTRGKKLSSNESHDKDSGRLGAESQGSVPQP
jgi:hypothetical protein